MSKIQKTILKAVTEFYSSKWRMDDFLTEDDIRCRLYTKLESALNGNRNVNVHAEVRWYGRNNDLKYRSDLVVLDHRNLNVNPVRLPSKGYSFNKYYCIIEIKLRRLNNKESNTKYDRIIAGDLEKLSRISQETGGEYDDNKSFILIAFDKKRSKKLLSINRFGTPVEWQNW